MVVSDFNDANSGDLFPVDRAVRASRRRLVRWSKYEAASAVEPYGVMSSEIACKRMRIACGEIRDAASAPKVGQASLELL
jgi:hypothetical protein